MPTESPMERLHLLARAAADQAKGNMDGAVERFDRLLTKENDAAIERALCRNWRIIAIRAELASAFTELRAEGRLPLVKDTPIRTTNYDTTRERSKPKTWAAQHVEKINERAENERNYLNEFRVNGEPIGDCTAEMVLAQAERREKDARFMRLVASGVPPEGKIRDYVTPKEAAERWDLAQKPVETEIIEVGPFKLQKGSMPEETIEAWNILHRGIKTKAQYEVCLDRAKELEAMGPQSKTWGEQTFTCYVRAIAEYEGKDPGFDWAALAELRKQK